VVRRKASRSPPGRPAAPVELLGLRLGIVPLVRVDDLADQAVPYHVLAGEPGEVDVLDAVEDVLYHAQPADLPGRQVDLVLSDMAPNLSGVDVVDQPRSLYLAELALDMSARVLKPGGSALIKVFQGAGFRELVQSARGRFARVRVVKPAASRSRSPEMYLLAMQFRLV